MLRIHWEAVARILLYGLTLDYFPLQLSPCFIVATVLGEHYITDEMFLNSFKNYVPFDEKETIQSSLIEFEETDALLDLLSYYKCYRKPTKDNIKEIFIELANQELVQRPRYVSNCFTAQFLNKLPVEFKTVNNIMKYYSKLTPSATKIVKCLNCSPASDQESSVLGHLSRYVKSLSQENMRKFLQFVTGGDLMPDGQITLEFVENQKPRAPVDRTCVPMMELSNSYANYNELAQEFNHILNNRESFLFSFM